MIGLDYLALPKYPSVARKELPPQFAIGCFSSTFGDARPAVEAILKTGKCFTVRVHLMWKDNHNFTTKDFPAIVKEAKKWVPLVNKYFEVTWYFSGACENHLSKKDALTLANKVLEVLPTEIYVNSGDAIISGPNIINEVHGVKAKALKVPYIFSYDGNACVDSNVEALKAKHKDAKIFFLWEPRFNGRWETNDNTPRPERKGWPDAKLIRSVVALATQTGTSKLPKKWIYKSHSENKGTGDPRAEKPVMIAPIKSTQISLKLGNDTKATLKYHSPYTDGRHRYYATKWGYEIASEPLDVWANGKKHGFVTPSFRANIYHD